MSRAGKKTGTREWSVKSLNRRVGCKNNCRYCWAAHDAIHRWGYVESRSEWTQPRPNKSREKPYWVPGVIMYPTTHDIAREHVRGDIEYLKSWLELDNRILIVSKPSFNVISTMTKELKKYKEQLEFRFSIGSMNNDALSFWEPEAPSFAERMRSAEIAFVSKYNVSISCEPYLDESIVPLVRLMTHISNGEIWIGMMNEIDKRVDTSGWSEEQLYWMKRLRAVHTREYVQFIHDTFKNEERVRWKDSIKDLLGLPEVEVG
jgi:DNA repair photolyase